MGVVITSNVDASSFAKKAVSAVQDGLQLMCFFDTSKQKATNNFALENDSKLIEKGSVIIDNTFTKFNPKTGTITTEIHEPDVCSMFIVVKANEKEKALEGLNNCSLLFGNFTGAAGISFGFQSSTTGLLSFGRRYKNAEGVSVNLTLTPQDTIEHKVGDWALYYVSFDIIRGYVKCFSSGAHEERAVSVGHSIVKESRPMLISAFYGGASQTGSVDISQLRFYDKNLTDREVQLIVNEMRQYELLHNSRVV